MHRGANKRRSGKSLGYRLLLLAAGMSFAINGLAIEIVDAARYQDAAAVETLLAKGADPNSPQADGETALHWAVYREDTDMVSALLEAGANVNAVNRLGASSMFIAASSANGAMIGRLLAAGADPNLALQMNETPIMTASRAGTVEGVRHLIEAGADVNARETSRNQTALMWAAAQGHSEVVQALVKAGADLEARSTVRPMLMFATETNGGAFDQGVMEQLGGYSPLLFAARQGHVEIAELLLAAGADIDGTAGNGTTPLVVATHSGHSRLARVLLDAGADANAIGAGYTALHAAILRADLATVAALLAHGADPDQRLLKPNPVQRSSEDWVLKTPLVGATPYWIAASFREAEIMRALVEGGADPLLTNEEVWSIPRERKDRESYTPEVIGGFESALQAVIKGDSTRDRFYVQPNPDPVAEERMALAAVIAAVDHGINLNHTDYTGSTALHDAAARDLAGIVRVLVERGADLNAANKRGQTPLDLAVSAEGRPSFFGFDLSVPGPSAREVLEELGAEKSSR